MTEPLLTRMVGLDSSVQIWQCLHSYFASHTRAQVKKLKIQLKQAKKDRSITTYLLDIKKVINSLAAVGSPVTTADHIDAIMDGLPEEYDSFITSITSRLDPYSVEDIEALLLAHEERLEKHKAAEPSFVHTNLTTSSSSSQRPKYVGTFSRGGRTNGRGYRSSRFNNQRSNSRGSWNSTNTSWNSSRSQCQICNKLGHTAVECWHRYDQDPPSSVHANASVFPPLSQDPNEPSILGNPSTLPDSTWFPDSGATHHMTNNASNFTKKQQYNGSEMVQLGNGSGMPIHHIGSATYTAPHTNHSFRLQNLLHVPSLSKNLLSVSKFSLDNNVYFEFYPHHCYVKHQDTKRIFLQGILKDGLYMFNIFPSPALNNTTAVPSIDLWHSRLAHASYHTVNVVLRKCNIRCTSTKQFCEPCTLAKAKQLPFTNSATVYNTPLQLVFADVWGPSPISATDGARYYIVFIDAYSKYIWLYLLHNKSQVPSTFMHFKSFAENQTGFTLKNLQTDNAKEFLCLKSTLLHYGIHHRLTCPHTHEQNGSVERRHRHIVTTGLALLAAASLPLTYWGEAFMTVVTVINTLPTPVLQNNNPYSMLFHKDPDYQFFKVFGCACYPLTRPYNQYKFDFRSSMCLFLGYSPHHKGYICLSPTGKRYISRHVIFNEKLFPYTLSDNPFKPMVPSLSTSPLLPSLTVLSPPLSMPSNTTSPFIPPSNIAPFNDTIMHDLVNTASSPSISDSLASSSPPPAPTIHKNQHYMVTRSNADVFKPKAFHSTIPTKPSNHKEALKSPAWFAAMNDEYQALLKNKTWILTHQPAGAPVVGCKWIFRNKYNADGTFQRHKARLVAKGFQQTAGMDYYDTFSPVVKATTIRLILTYAISNKWFVHQLDINNAFLYGHLEEVFFMQQPPGFEAFDSSLACQLKKAIYGLKQAPRSWFTKLSTTLEHLGFQSTKSDSSLFVQFTNNHTLFVLVYVDDILITGSSHEAIQQIIKQLSNEFALKDLGRLHFFLGIHVLWNSDGSLHLSQNQYITDLLQRTNMHNSKPLPTPMISSSRLSQDGTTAFYDPTLYRSVVGSLQYLTITRPELAFSVNKVSQFMHSPQEHHWCAVKRILRYLVGTKHHGLHIRPSPQLNLYAFCDADWGVDPDDRKSISYMPSLSSFISYNLLNFLFIISIK